MCPQQPTGGTPLHPTQRDAALSELIQLRLACEFDVHDGPDRAAALLRLHELETMLTHAGILLVPRRRVGRPVHTAARALRR